MLMLKDTHIQKLEEQVDVLQHRNEELCGQAAKLRECNQAAEGQVGHVHRS